MIFKVFSIPIYLTIIFFSSFALAETIDKCEQLLEYSHPRLTPDLVSKINTVSESDAYTLQMLRRLKGDHEQIILLVGETHTKKPEDKKIGADLIKESSFRGLEDAQGIPDSLLERIFSSYTKFLIEKLRKEKGETASSSIFDAMDSDLIVLSFLKEKLSGMTEEAIDILRADLETLPDDELKKRVAFTLRNNFGEGKVITWFDIKDTVQRFLLASRNNPKVESQQDILTTNEISEEPEMSIPGNSSSNFLKTITFNIEEGYRPGLYDRLKNIYFDLSLTIMGSSAIALITPFPTIKYIALFLGGTAYAFTKGRPWVGKKIQSQELRYLFLPEEGQMANRDSNSASNIEAQLERYPDEQLLIVVLGEAHVEGVSRELINLGPYSRIQSLKPIH